MSGPRTAKDRAADAAIAEANAVARRRHAQATAEYEERTAKLYFTKKFNTALEALMRDRLAPAAERILAWIERYSWGEYSLFAIGQDGLPKYQRDIELELGIVKQTVSKTVKYLQQRGYLEDQGKLLIPIVEPVLAGPPEGNPRLWEAFLDQWKVAHSTDFAEWEVSRANVKRFRAVALSDYKIWKKQKEQETSEASTLCKTSESNTETTARLQVLTPLEENQRRHTAREGQRENQPETHSVDGGMHAKALLEGRALLFREIAHMQKAYKNTSFAQEPIDPQRKEHQALVNLILTELGDLEEQYLIGYCCWVTAQFKGIGFGGKKLRTRPPGSQAGPEGLGLLVPWARDYARANAQRGQGAGR